MWHIHKWLRPISNLLDNHRQIHRHQVHRPSQVGSLGLDRYPLPGHPILHQLSNHIKDRWSCLYPIHIRIHHRRQDHNLDLGTWRNCRWHRPKCSLLGIDQAQAPHLRVDILHPHYSAPIHRITPRWYSCMKWRSRRFRSRRKFASLRDQCRNRNLLVWHNHKWLRPISNLLDSHRYIHHRQVHRECQVGDHVNGQGLAY